MSSFLAQWSSTSTALQTYSVLNCFLSSPSFAKPLFHTIMHIFGRSVVADWAYTLYRTTRLTSSVPSLFRINASIVSDSFALCNNRVNAVFVNQKTRKNSLFYFFSVTFHRSGAICFHKTTLQFFLITQVKLNHFQAWEFWFCWTSERRRNKFEVTFVTCLFQLKAKHRISTTAHFVW